MKKLILMIMTATMLFAGWGSGEQKFQITNSGVSAVEAREAIKVKRNSKGFTLEQQNIIDSYKVENEPGAIKHLYVISTFTGKILRYSTVMGKVTANTKGLSPSSVNAQNNSHSGQSDRGMKSEIHGKLKYTKEVMQESGTFGSSSPYIYWFDTKGVYHKMLMNHNAYVEISNQPLPVSAQGELVIKFH